MKIATILALGGLMALGACTQPRPGYCTSDAECPMGQHCQTGSGIDKFMCTSNLDGGPDGAGATDGSGDGIDAQGCRTSQECPTDTPICVNRSCTSCGPTDGGSSACALRDSAHPVCGSNGTCLECVTSQDCSRDPTKPICAVSTNTCGACTADSDCTAKGIGPGVCMAHQDGRCATDAETIYVQFTAPCATAPGGGNGTAASPFCGMAAAVLAVSNSRRVIVVVGSVPGSAAAMQGASVGSTQVSIVGQSTAIIGSSGSSTPNLTIDGANVFIRSVSLKNSLDLGISVKNAATIQLDTVTFDSNSTGGLLVDSSAFDVRDSVFTKNGPGDAMGAAWGGMRIQGTLSAASASLEQVTIINNGQVGISCTMPVSGTEVFASGNAGGVDISPSCGFSSCPTLGTACGATP